MKILFKHCHLILDDKNEYIDGAILVKEDKILELYPHSNKIKDSFDDVKEIDIKGNIIMPALFENHYDDKKDLIGVANYLYDIPSILDIDNNKHIDDQRYLGLYLDKCFVLKEYSELKKELDEEIIKIILSIKSIKAITLSPELLLSSFISELCKKNNIKIYLGKSNAYNDDINCDYDAIRNLFFDMPRIDHLNKSLSNIAFDNKGYVEVSTNIDKDILKLCLNNIDKDKILIINNNGAYETIKILNDLNIDKTDILKMTSLNYYHLYELDKLHGSLRKGKYSNMIILDKEMNIIGTYINGELNYE